MPRFANFARWMWAAIVAIIASPIVAQFIIKWIERKGFYDRPDEAAGWAVHLVATIAQLPGMMPVALLLLGVAIGAWSDSFLRKIDGSRSHRLRMLGFAMHDLGQDVARAQNSISGKWVDNISRDGADFLAMSIRCRKAGLWFPGQRVMHSEEEGKFLAGYLLGVGKLLEEEHFSEARELAAQYESEFQRKFV